MTIFPRAVPLLHDFLARSAARSPGEVALVTEGRRLTYAELEGRANALAHALVRRGVERGDRVVIFGDNRAETVVAFWGALKANAVASIVNPQTKRDKLAYILGDCRPTALVTEAPLRRAFAEPAAASPHLRTVVVFGDTDVATLAALPGGVAWDDALAGESTAGPPTRRSIDVDLASIIYTSGSTGEPKGVMHTHRSMRVASTSITSYLENREDDVILNVLPLSFDYGLYQMIMAVQLGARLVLERSFTYRGRVLDLLVEEGVTGFPGVPTIFALMAEMKDLDRYDFSRVRYVTNTAAALPKKHITMLVDMFPNARVYSMYGLTECKRVSWLPPKDILQKPDSVGLPIPNTEVWIAGDDGQRLGPGEIGQIVVRGGTIMRGYWEKPEATAKRLQGGPLPWEQVLLTGDLGRMDEEGYLYFVGRMDDIIKCRGEKVAPKEVEGVLMDVPGVREAAVAGVPDPVLGQMVKAWVVLEDGSGLTTRDLQRACRERLEGFMVPGEIDLVDALEKTTSGKIKKPGAPAGREARS